MPRSASLCLLLVLLAGCAGTPREAPTSGYFSTSLPLFDYDPLMSPVDNPILELRSFQQPPVALVREILLAQHQRWVGTPYRLGGNGQNGVDCSALMQHVFSDSFGMSLPRTTGAQALHGQRVERSELRAGDLVFFRPPGSYNHVGVYIGDGFFLHASTSQGVILSELENDYWQRHYWQARRPMEQNQLAQRAIWSQRS